MDYIRNFTKRVVLLLFLAKAGRVLTRTGLFLLLLFSQPVEAQSYHWQQDSSGGYGHRYVQGDPMKARFYTLRNGLTVILSVNKKEPRIKALIGIRAGSNEDPADHTGLAHYLEHLLFKGTDKYGSLNWEKEKPYLDEITRLYERYNHSTDTALRSAIYHAIDSVSGIAARYAIANEYDKMMGAIGAQGTNAHTSVEETVYEEDIPAGALDKFLAIQAERFRSPVFRLFHTELEAVYEEKNRGLDNDGRRVYEEMLAALFPTHHYGTQTTIGTVEHLKNPSLTAIRDFYDRYYVPGNMAIVMVGDLDPDATIRKIDAAFSCMQPRSFEAYEGPVEAPLNGPVMREITGPDAENLTIAYRMPGALQTREAVLLMVLSEVLSNGKAGLLDLDLNKQQRLLGSSAGVNYLKDYSIFQLTGRAKPGQSLAEVKDLLLGELEQVKAGQFDASLLKAIVANFKLADLQGLDNNNNRAVSLMDGFIKHRGNNWDRDVTFTDDMGKVTKEELVAFAREYLSDNYVVVFKKTGATGSAPKVVKPPITPVETNSNSQSAFATALQAISFTPIKPQWLDYARDIQHAKSGKSDLLYVKNKDNSLFRLYYRFEMGSWNNRLLPLAAAYLQFLGTERYNAEQISRAFYDIACNFTVTPGNEVTTVTITGLQENFDKAVQLLDHLLHNCQPDEAALTAYKARLDKARADSRLNKTNILRGLTQYAMYGAHNPYNYQLTPDELGNLTSRQLTELLHSLLSFQHTVIYYGPAMMDEIKAAIRQWHPAPERFQPVPAPVKFERVAQPAMTVLFTHYDMLQAEVQWVHNGSKFDTSLATTLDVFNNYFGGGMGSVVFQQIRESKGLAYSTYAFYAQPGKKEDPYTAMAYVGSQADKMKEAISGMQELLKDLPVSEKAFETAKQSIKQDIETERITGDGIVSSYLAARRLGYRDDYRKRVYNKIDGIRFSDIQRLHQEAMKDKAYTLCILASGQKVSAEDLKKYGEVKQLTLEEIFGY